MNGAATLPPRDSISDRVSRVATSTLHSGTKIDGRDSETGLRRLLVVVINWHMQTETLACLRQLRDQQIPGMKILLIDNEGNEETAGFFRERSKLYDYYRRYEENLGFTGACNRGLQLAFERGFALTFFLNNDATLGERCIRDLAETIEADPRIALVSPVLRDEQNGEAHFCGATPNAAYPSLRYLSLEEAAASWRDIDCYLYGTALLARTDIVHRHGGFCGKYFAYWEDFELCHRLIANQFRSLIVPHASVTHTNQRGHEAGTTRSKYYHYYVSRNEYDFLRKAYRGRMKVRALLWFFDRSLRRSQELSARGHKAQASAVRMGVIDGVFGRFGKWRHHPRKT
jgi:GT2 family glycosyltransferase